MGKFTLHNVRAATPKHWEVIIRILPKLDEGDDDYKVFIEGPHYIDTAWSTDFQSYIQVDGPHDSWLYGLWDDEFYGLLNADFESEPLAC